jgi:hypothetical protein
VDRKPKRKHKRRTGRNEKEEKVGGGKLGRGAETI